jgi:hypothetical protein
VSKESGEKHHVCLTSNCHLVVLDLAGVMLLLLMMVDIIACMLRFGHGNFFGL